MAALADPYARGHEPAALLRSLARLGDTDLAADTDAVPPLAELALSRPNLRWRMQLSTTAPCEDIGAVFDLVGDDAEVAVTLLQDDPPPATPPLAAPAASQVPTAAPPPLRPVPDPDTTAAILPMSTTICVYLDRVNRLQPDRGIGNS